MKPIHTIIFLFSLLFFVTGCAPKYSSMKEVSKAQLEKLDFDEIEGFHADNLDLALRVFQKDCVRAKRYKIFKQVCKKAENTNNPKDFFTQNFTPFKLRSKQGNDQGIITGYYEPLLQGSLKKTKEFKYPIYKTPKDLIVVDLRKIYPELKKYRLRGRVVGNKLIPYDSRTLMRKKKDLEVIAYVNDKVDLYFLEIQGSGKIELRDGSIMNVGFANQNGHQYESIGKYMIKKAYIGGKSGYSASIQGMKKWFNENPAKVDNVLNINPSYVFFAQNKRGATGSLGTELTSRRNLAVDRRYIPLGMPVFINTKNPVTKEKINQLMVAADTGGAIKGEIRADFFWGFAKEAEKYAGRMKEQGQLIMLIPN